MRGLAGVPFSLLGDAPLSSSLPISDATPQRHRFQEQREWPVQSQSDQEAHPCDRRHQHHHCGDVILPPQYSANVSERRQRPIHTKAMDAADSTPVNSGRKYLNGTNQRSRSDSWFWFSAPRGTLSTCCGSHFPLRSIRLEGRIDVHPVRGRIDNDNDDDGGRIDASGSTRQIQRMP